ncbi:MAG: hypothetical protein M1829_001633 [Trizodia sp. TS-e1964]|nr:MAG: hypothetical protein M1829_001633 [Trizodia sp. TS-e1964]
MLRLKSAGFGIDILSSIGGAGHSLVFEVSAPETGLQKAILKIFRFPVVKDPNNLHNELDPYIYFDREERAYSYLSKANSPLFPRFIRSVVISSEDEAALLEAKLLSFRPASYRRKLRTLYPADLPLKALMVEFIPGPRLSSKTPSQAPELGRQLLKAIEIMHDCGVVWGDAKWRNILVIPDGTERYGGVLINQVRGLDSTSGDRLVVLDFSNSHCWIPQNFAGADVPCPKESAQWQAMIKQENLIIEGMISKWAIILVPLEVVSTEQDPNITI